LAEEKLKTWILLILIIILAGAVGALAFLYISGSDELTQANTKLDLANSRITNLEANLASGANELTQAKARITSMEASLKLSGYPSHFESLDALKAWLAIDDTNSKYASIPAVDRAYILEIRSARDGFLLPAYFEQDSKDATKLYFLNLANIAGKFYVVNSANDTVNPLNITLTNPPALRPLLPVTPAK
jgi:hypothetical protein